MLNERDRELYDKLAILKSIPELMQEYGLTTYAEVAEKFGMVSELDMALPKDRAISVRSYRTKDFKWRTPGKADPNWAIDHRCVKHFVIRNENIALKKVNKVKKAKK